LTCIQNESKDNVNIDRHRESYDNEYWTHLQSLSQSFTRLGVELVPLQVEICETLVHLRVEKKLQQIKKITFGVGLTSRAFASALPASASRLFSPKFSVVILVFTYQTKLAVRRRAMTLKMANLPLAIWQPLFRPPDQGCSIPGSGW
jgi:hypothetical protein